MNCRYDKFLECSKSETERDIHCKYCPHYDPADLARHIAKGNQQRQEYDYSEVEDRLRLKLDVLRDKLPDLTDAELRELECGLDAFTRMAELFLKRHRPLTVDEQPDSAPNTRESFDGTEDNPIPLGSKPEDLKMKSTTIIEAIVETLGFETLKKIATVLEVPCDFGSWHGDEFAAKEDDLRVAVAEAMEKAGVSDGAK